MELNDKLKKLDSYPFHMPGHKRNDNFNIPSAELDITEIDGFDNLHNAKDLLKNMQEDLSELYNSEKSLISVNGSTCCILAAICGVCEKGDRILIARNCHKAVYNACMLHELRVEYIEPEFDYEFGVYTKITQSSIDSALKLYDDIKAIVITSPTYEGITSSISSSVPIIIDAAHGSHFGFGDFLPEKAKGDVVINSLHKTLPCLTQCAAIHIYNEKYYNKIKKYMDIFETSSPSYVLMSSIDRCIDFLKSSKDEFEKYKILLNNFHLSLSETDNIHLFKNDDPTRIVLRVDGYSGTETAEKLRSDKIEVEAVGDEYVILISTVCDNEYGFRLLTDSLKKFENRNDNNKKHTKPVIPAKALEQFEINKTTETEFDNCVGKICGESIFAYPPDIPIIAAGEIISKECIDYISHLIEEGVNVLSDSDLLPDRILTKED